MKNILFSAILFALCLFSQQTFAQDSKQIERKGLIFGISNGIAYSFLNFPGKTQTDTDIALDVKLGFMIKPNLALLLSTNVSIYDYSGFGRNRKRDFGVLAPSIQYWFIDKLWVLGGIGLGGDNPVFYDIKKPDADPLETKYYHGLGLVSSLGYEIYQRKNLAIDLKTKITYRNVELGEGKTSGLSPAILLGINFY